MSLPIQINTKGGVLELLPVPQSIQQLIHRALPFGMHCGDGSVWGITLQCGTREILGVKFQPGDASPQDANTFRLLHSCALAVALAALRSRHFRGVILPFCYVRRKTIQDEELVEVSTACFPCPVDGEPDCGSCSAEDYFDDSFDNVAGPGSGKMLAAFYEAYESTLRSFGQHIHFIGLDVRPRSALGTIATDFLLAGSDLVCIKRHIDAADLSFKVLVEKGVTSMWHMPSVPVAD